MDNFSNLKDKLHNLIHFHMMFAIQFRGTDPEKYHAFQAIADLYQRQLDALLAKEA